MSQIEPLELSQIAGAGSVVVADSLQLRSGLAAYIRPITSNVRFCGRAVTVTVEPGDNRAAYEALNVLQRDDVLVVGCVETHDVAMVGGTLAGHCRNLRAVGIVTDGMVRDIAELERLGLPIWARGIIPNAPKKLAAGQVGQPVSIGGVIIATGDVLVADLDGVTVVPRCPPARFLEDMRLALERETLASQEVEEGKREPAWLRAIRSKTEIR